MRELAVTATRCTTILSAHFYARAKHCYEWPISGRQATPVRRAFDALRASVYKARSSQLARAAYFRMHACRMRARTAGIQAVRSEKLSWSEVGRSECVCDTLSSHSPRMLFASPRPFAHT